MFFLKICYSGEWSVSTGVCLLSREHSKFLRAKITAKHSLSMLEYLDSVSESDIEAVAAILSLPLESVCLTQAPTPSGLHHTVVWWLLLVRGISNTKSILGPRFSKVPRTFRARKAIRKSTTCLFCKAGLFMCCKGNKNKNNCKVSCLETPSF